MQLYKYAGNIPKKIGALLNLQALDMTFNNLSGQVPREIGNLTKLRDLYLGANMLFGKLILFPRAMVITNSFNVIFISSFTFYALRLRKYHVVTVQNNGILKYRYIIIQISLPYRFYSILYHNAVYPEFQYTIPF